MAPGEKGRVILTDVPFNIPISGHVTSGAHREFAIAAGEMTREEFEDFIHDWMKASAVHAIDGGLIATFINWRSVELSIAHSREAARPRLAARSAVARSARASLALQASRGT